MLGSLLEMPRTPKKTPPTVPHVGLQNNGGAKRGRKSTVQNLLTEIIDKYFEGDRKLAALAWEITPNYLSQVIAAAKITEKLALRIFLSTKQEIPIEKILEMVPAKQ